MAKILPESVHKILYLDADMIVRHDLSELWNTPLNNVAVAGVMNQSDCGQFWVRLGYPQELGYFNSGVLLLNLDYIREQNMTDQFIAYLKENPDVLLCPDQDVLNYVLKDHKLLLPVRYNAQEGFYRNPPQSIFGDIDVFENDVNNPYIVHYTKEKPWMANCMHPLKELYYYYKSQTPWTNNDFMEHFKYKNIDAPLSIKIKKNLYRIINTLKRGKDNNIVYKTIKLNS